MKSTTLKIIIVFSVCAWFFISCNEANNKSETAIAPSPTDLNNVVTKLPEAPGYATFQSNCISCHSARFIQMQPNLSEKTWLAIVTKMQKSFGAPVPDSSNHTIVQYLVAIKGKN